MIHDGGLSDVATMERETGSVWPRYVRSPIDKHVLYGVDEDTFQVIKAWHEDRGETVDEVFR